MLDRTDLEPVFFAPFVSSLMRVEPQWIDYNGHLNMAYYNVLFDRAVDEVYELLGVGAAYLKDHRHSTFTAEVHVRYVRELHENDPVRVTFQLLGYDSKRFHYFEQLFHATEGLGFGNVGEYDAARGHDDEESRAVSGCDHANACAHEGCARALAAPGSCRAAHCDAAEGLIPPTFPRVWPRRRARWRR
jgi:Predicted thioesterase